MAFLTNLVPCPADADDVGGLAGLGGVVDEARAVAPRRRQDPLQGHNSTGKLFAKLLTCDSLYYCNKISLLGM